MADVFDLNNHQFFVPMTEYIRPNGRQEGIRFPVIDQETVNRAAEVVDNGFTYACEAAGPIAIFYIVDDVAEYDVATKMFTQNEFVIKSVSDMIKSWSVEQLLAQREIYIRNQENAND